MAGLLIYGAYGYTGRLIAEKAVAAGLAPVLAGRNAGRLAPVAERLGCESLAIGLDDGGALADALAPFDAVIHAAGPFAQTSAPMVAACLAARTHYMDITGEIEVFAACAARDAEARAAGVMLLPGCGFDVVPTDCVALMLARTLPDATLLQLAFKGSGTPSRGTLRTALNHLAEPVQVCRGGRIVAREGRGRMVVDFGDGPEAVQATTWGDVFTAHRSTGIPDIEVFLVVPPSARLLFALPIWVRRILASAWLRPLLERKLQAGPEGPDETARATGESRVWGRVRNAAGDSAEAVLRTAEGYEFTGRAATEIARRVLAGQAPVGYQTPAMAFGPGLVLDIEGSRMIRAPGPE